MKVPSSNYIYIHDCNLRNGGHVGLKFNTYLSQEGNTLANMHLENITIDNCENGAVDWGDDSGPPTFNEIVVKGVYLTNNTNSNYVRLRGCLAAHEYGDNIGLVIARAGTINSIPHTTGAPADDNVGWTSWGNP